MLAKYWLRRTPEEGAEGDLDRRYADAIRDICHALDEAANATAKLSAQQQSRVMFRIRSLARAHGTGAQYTNEFWTLATFINSCGD